MKTYKSNLLIPKVFLRNTHLKLRFISDILDLEKVPKQSVGTSRNNHPPFSLFEEGFSL